MTDSQLIRKFLRSSLRWRCTSSCARSLISWHPIYFTTAVQHVGPRLDFPQDIAGRRLFLFERAEGENNVWYDLSPGGKVRAYVSYLSRSMQFSCPNLL